MDTLILSTLIAKDGANCVCSDSTAVLSIDIIDPTVAAIFSCSCPTGTSSEYLIVESTGSCGCFDSTGTTAIMGATYNISTGICECLDATTYIGTITGGVCDPQPVDCTAPELSESGNYQVVNGTSSCKCQTESGVDIPDSIFNTTGTPCTCDSATNSGYSGIILTGKCVCTTDAVELADNTCKTCAAFTDPDHFNVGHTGVDGECECLNASNDTIVESFFNKDESDPCKCSCNNCDSTKPIFEYKCVCTENVDSSANTGNFYIG